MKYPCLTRDGKHKLIKFSKEAIKVFITVFLVVTFALIVTGMIALAINNNITNNIDVFFYTLGYLGYELLAYLIIRFIAIWLYKNTEICNTKDMP